jgi:hypothetical protein
MGKMAMYYGKTLKVKPFGLMTGSELPTKKLATKLDTKWNPIYSKMMESPGVSGRCGRRTSTEQIPPS